MLAGGVDVKLEGRIPRGQYAVGLPASISHVPTLVERRILIVVVVDPTPKTARTVGVVYSADELLMLLTHPIFHGGGHGKQSIGDVFLGTLHPGGVQIAVHAFLTAGCLNDVPSSNFVRNLALIAHPPVGHVCRR